MSSSPLIDAPASFVPAVGLSFGQPGVQAAFVDAANPLPVCVTPAAADLPALAGTASAPERIGPFVPVLGRPIHLSLSGSWTGQVRVLRSTDGGATAEPLTLAGSPWGVFTANANEAVAEESVGGATYFLDLAPVTGAIRYRVAQ